jgi:hypothetical protein
MYEATVNLFSVPFDVNVESVPVKFQMEMKDMWCDVDLRNAFWHVQHIDFYKLCLSAGKFPVLSDHAW